MERLCRFLDGQQIAYQRMDEHGVLAATIPCHGRLKRLGLILQVFGSSFAANAICTVYAQPEDKTQIRQLALFEMLVNSHMRSGCFQLDVDEGEIRYEMQCDATGWPLTDEAIHEAVYTPIVMFEHYGDGLLGILFGAMDAQDALARYGLPVWS